MKPTSLLSSKAWMAFVVACSGFIILLSACSKNDPEPEPVGEAKVRYINTVQGSSSQDLYVNNTKKNTTPVAYGSASEYLSFTSGGNVFKLQDAGTTTMTAESQPVGVQIGTYISVFFYKTPGGQNTVGLTTDDMTAPPAGKAKVRFINLNNFLNANISITVTGQSAALIPSLAYGGLSDYLLVDAGSTFTAAGAGVTTAPVIDGGIVAGKNYTIWIDGTSATNLMGHVSAQN